MKNSPAIPLTTYFTRRIKYTIEKNTKKARKDKNAIVFRREFREDVRFGWKRTAMHL